MAEWRSCADEILALDLAQGHAFAGSRRQGQIALAHRTRLRGAERRTRIGPLRRSRLAWLSPPRDAPHRSLRLSDLRTGSDSPLSLLAAQDASVTQRFSTPRRRRSDQNVTSKTRSRRSENSSPSRSQKPLCDVHAVKQRTARQLPISVHDTVELAKRRTTESRANTQLRPPWGSVAQARAVSVVRWSSPRSSTKVRN